MRSLVILHCYLNLCVCVWENRVLSWDSLKEKKSLDTWCIFYKEMGIHFLTIPIKQMLSKYLDYRCEMCKWTMCFGCPCFSGCLGMEVTTRQMKDEKERAAVHGHGVWFAWIADFRAFENLGSVTPVQIILTGQMKGLIYRNRSYNNLVAFSSLIYIGPALIS